MRTTSEGIFHDDFTLEREHHEDGEKQRNQRDGADHGNKLS